MNAQLSGLPYEEMIRRELLSLPPRGQALVAKYFQDNNLLIKKDPYFSKGRVQATVTGTTTKTYAIAAGTVLTFFNYGLGDPLTNAGFPSSFGNATYADTNIPTKFQTKDGELVEIQGAMVQLHPDSDPKVAQLLMAEAYLEMGTGSDTKPYKLGPPMFVPGGPGLISAGLSNVVEANLRDAFAVIPGNPVNGWQVPQSILDFGFDSLIWAPPGEADSNFSVNLVFPRAISWTMSDRAAAAGTTAAETAPSSGSKGTLLDFFFRLKSRQVTRRSSNR